MADASRNPNARADQGGGLRPRPQISHQRGSSAQESPLPVPSLRRRLEQSEFLVRVFGAIGTGYLRLCLATTRWTYEGVDQVVAEAANGPVLYLMWHERSLFGPAHWPAAAGELSTLYAASAIGRVGGDMHRRFGRRPVRMSEKASNAQATREVLRRVKDGISIGMTTDGPQGPARVVNEATLGWAKAMGRPIFAYAYAVKRHKRLGTWDRLMFPWPFTRGHVVFVRWDGEVARKASADQMQAVKAGLEDALNTACEMADAGLKATSLNR